MDEWSISVCDIVFIPLLYPQLKFMRVAPPVVRPDSGNR